MAGFMPNWHAHTLFATFLLISFSLLSNSSDPWRGIVFHFVLGLAPSAQLSQFQEVVALHDTYADLLDVFVVG